MRRLAIVAALVLLVPTTGCVMAARHLATEANRSGFQDKARKRFPVGTPIETARADLLRDGYRCLDMPGNAKVKPHVSCWSGHRTQFVEKFLVGGNWRYDLYPDGDRLAKLHISSARHGMRRLATATAPTAPKSE